jgi:type II secretory pathway pseudopilin PulG
MSILISFLFGIIAVAGIKLLGRSRGTRQLGRVEELVAAERQALAARQAANPAAWSGDAGDTFLSTLQEQLTAMEAIRVDHVSDESFERTVYELDQFTLALVGAGGTWEVWLGRDGQHDAPASFWLAAVAGSTEVPDREADYVALTAFAYQLPTIVSDWARLEPIVTTISQESARRFRTELRSAG